MSKSLSTLLPPALGGTALVLAGAYGLANRDYGESQIEALQTQVAQIEESAGAASEKAAAEAARASELELKIAEVQAAAAERSASGSNLTTPAPRKDGTFGLGRTALPQEIAAWDVDVLPDGRGLPDGSGDVFTGEEVFVEKCGSCHGDFAEGVDNWPVLAGGFDTLADEDPVKTVGSYWPFLSTAWDYVHRSMPFGEAGTLTADETYAIVAYILYSNDVVDDEFVLSKENFNDVAMHNAEGFIVDDRPDLEYSEWRAEPCMENCKDKVDVTMRTVFLVDTPPEGGSDSIVNPNREEPLPSFSADGADYVPAAATTTTTTVVEEEKPKTEEVDPLIAKGEKVFKKCKACHQVGENAKNKTGPVLNAIMDATIGGNEGFKYSAGFKKAAEEGRVWDAEAMAEFLSKPKAFMPGTKMSFAGLKKQDEIDAIIAYLRSFDE